MGSEEPSSVRGPNSNAQASCTLRNPNSWNVLVDFMTHTMDDRWMENRGVFGSKRSSPQSGAALSWHLLAGTTRLTKILSLSRPSFEPWTFITPLYNAAATPACSVFEIISWAKLLTLESPVVTLCTTTFNRRKFYVMLTECFHEVSRMDYKTAIISLYSISRLIFITVAVCLLCGTDWIFIYNSI